MEGNRIEQKKVKRTSEKGGEMHKSIDIHYFPCCCCDYQDSYFTTFYFGNIPLSSKKEKICVSREKAKKFLIKIDFCTLLWF